MRFNKGTMKTLYLEAFRGKVCIGKKWRNTFNTPFDSDNKDYTFRPIQENGLTRKPKGAEISLNIL